MVIAVDFDGTLVENGVYPYASKPIIKNIEYIKKMKSEGHKIILWTCREKEPLEYAIKFCIDYGIELDAVNENVDIEDKLAVNDAIKDLKSREQYILEERFITGKTQMEIADELSISQAQVSRLEKNAIKTLKKSLNHH